DGLDGVGQLVDVQHFHPLQLRNLVEVEVVGQHLGPLQLGQPHQLGVDVGDVVEVVVDDPHGHLGLLLHPVEDVQAAAAAVTLEHVGGVGDVLQFLQDEAGNQQGAFKKAGTSHVGDAAVDDDACVQNLKARVGRAPGCATLGRQFR